jgi:hypothetical protein
MVRGQLQLPMTIRWMGHHPVRTTKTAAAVGRLQREPRRVLVGQRGLGNDCRGPLLCRREVATLRIISLRTLQGLNQSPGLVVRSSALPLAAQNCLPARRAAMPWWGFKVHRADTRPRVNVHEPRSTGRGWGHTEGAVTRSRSEMEEDSRASLHGTAINTRGPASVSARMYEGTMGAPCRW